MVDKCNNTHLSCNEPRTQLEVARAGGRAGITEATLRNRISEIFYKIPQANRTE
jgi:transcription initiation factor TFIIIB Brf1 subunit/transcription initiation factor TFIIB